LGADGRPDREHAGAFFQLSLKEIADEAKRAPGSLGCRRFLLFWNSGKKKTNRQAAAYAEKWGGFRRRLKAIKIKMP